jgi:hypothetical protein
LSFGVCAVKLSNRGSGIGNMFVGDKRNSFRAASTIVAQFGVLDRGDPLEEIL